MRKLAKLGIGSMFAVCLMVVMAVPVNAYIDPSAVTYIIQAVAAAFIAVGALLTVFRHKIFAFFKKTKKETKKREIHVKENATEKSSNE